MTLTDGENGDGSPAVAEVLTLRCRLTCRPAESITPNRDYGDGSRRGIEAERVAVRCGGTALFDGDIAPAARAGRHGDGGQPGVAHRAKLPRP